jgi:dTDP-L-rhamnose 4-epimerase
VVILVTGGAGFIGSHVVDLLVAQGHEVRVLDLLEPQTHRVRPDYLNPGADVRVADVRDADAVAEAVRGVDAVSHQAAMVGLGVDLDDIVDYVAHNDLGTAVLLRALHRAGFGGRFVLASSMVVYGEGAYRCDRCAIPVRPAPRSRAELAVGRFEPRCPRCGGNLRPEVIDEDSPVDPRNVYAATKVHQEHLLSAFGRETRASVAALRYHNVYGPRMPRDTPYAGVASVFRSALAAGQPPRVFEDGGQLRNFVHVHDVARANALALTSDAPGAFNVAAREPMTIGAMATALVAAFGRDAPRPEVTGEFRLGDVRHVFASPTRAREALGFEAEIDPLEGLRRFATDPLRDDGRDDEPARIGRASG